MIAEMRLSQLRDRCDGELFGADLVFDSVSTDTRNLSQGDVYVALTGEHFDGHSFVSNAATRAKAIVVERKSDESVPQVVVEDSRSALGQIAGFCRDSYEGPVVAITGSSGKTTARNMLAAIMSTQGDVCTNLANQNNEVGVPFTLLGLNKKHVAAVVELGARHLGDISYLGSFVKPSISILLNAGSAHIGEFGGYENIVAGKGEIYSALKDGGVAIVNLDDPASETWLKSLGSKLVVTYSIERSDADVRAENIDLDVDKCSFDFVVKGDRTSVSLCTSGAHNVSNALAAVSAANVLSVPMDAIAKGLSLYAAEPGRLTRKSIKDGLELIDDSYNANPASMKAALDVLSLESTYRVAILGEMGELGEDALALHLQVAQHAAKSSIEAFWFIGPFSEQMKQVVGERARVFTTKHDIAEAITEISILPATLLIKASRFVALEDVVEMNVRGTA